MVCTCITAPRKLQWLCTENVAVLLQQGRFSNRGKSIFKADGIVATTTLLALRLYESRKRPSAPTTDTFTSKRSQKHHVGVQHTLLDDGSGERKESEFLQSWHNDGNEGTIWKIAQSPPKDDILQCRVPFIMDLVYPPLHCSRKSCRNVRLGEKLCDALLLPVCVHKTE